MKRFIKKCPLICFTFFISIIVGAYFAVKYIPTENVVNIFGQSTNVSSSENSSSDLKSTEISSSSPTNAVSEVQPSKPQEPKEPEKPKKPIVEGPIDDDFFNDAIFVGDSITEGLCGYGNIKTADYFYHIGLSVNQLFNNPKADDRTGKTLAQTLNDKQYKKIYIHLGINELGTGTAESFTETYSDTIQKIKEYDPDALIFIDSIFPVTKGKSDKDKTFKIATVNARNASLKTYTELEENVYFLDLSPAMVDENGYMRPDFSNDSIHPKAKYYPLVCDQIKKATAQALGIE